MLGVSKVQNLNSKIYFNNSVKNLFIKLNLIDNNNILFKYNDTIYIFARGFIFYQWYCTWYMVHGSIHGTWYIVSNRHFTLKNLKIIYQYKIYLYIFFGIDNATIKYFPEIQNNRLTGKSPN